MGDARRLPQVHPSRRDAVVALLSLVLLALAACGSSAPPAAPRSASTTCLNPFVIRSYPPYTLSCYVTFAAGVSYAQALRTVTDLGLQPLIDCPSSVGLGSSIGMGRWVPVGQRDTYARTHALLLETFDVPPRAQLDWPTWPTLLLSAPGVVSEMDAVWNNRWETSADYTFDPLQDGATVSYSCPSTIPGDVPPAGIPVLLTNGQAGAYARVNFAPPASSYDAALALVADLGLRLANPCTERPGMDTLTTAGQEAAFQHTQALVVATTTAASNVWQRQLQSSAGVAAITTPYTPACS